MAYGDLLIRVLCYFFSATVFCWKMILCCHSDLSWKKFVFRLFQFLVSIVEEQNVSILPKRAHKWLCPKEKNKTTTWTTLVLKCSTSWSLAVTFACTNEKNQKFPSLIHKIQKKNKVKKDKKLSSIAWSKSL